MTLRTLLVDDEPGFRGFASQALGTAGIQVVSVSDVEEAATALAAGQFDVILLDIQMPGASGWEFLERIRATGDDVPVIFVSGLSETVDRVRGLRLGADDYLVKPVDVDELVARITAVVRRRRSLPTLHLGSLALDLGRRSCTDAGRPVELTPREFDVLHKLFEASGSPVSRRTFLRDVWDLKRDPETNLVEVHIARLRRKLSPSGDLWIETIRGEGYALRRKERNAPS